MEALLVFFVWTLLLYLMHVLAHTLPFLKRIHAAHHKTIKFNNSNKWHWNNLLLYNDNWISTVDLWISDIFPTLVVAIVFNAWWVAVVYYVWAAFFQESLEHNMQVNFYPFTCGQWHMRHHQNPKCNYGLFFPIWDKLFRTENAVK